MFIRNAFEPVYNAFCIFHSFTFISSDNILFIFCNMCLLVLPISFFAGFNNLAVGRFKTFSLWSFNVMKLLLVKIFNKNPIKLSYSCKPNIGSKINGHNKKILQPKPAEPQKLCNWLVKYCTLNGLSLTSSILYQATIKMKQK